MPHQPNEGNANKIHHNEIFQEEEEISLTSPAEILPEIKTNINPKKVPGYDLITGEALKLFPHKALVT